MKKLIITSLCSIIIASCSTKKEQKTTTIESPDGSIQVHLGVQHQKAFYYITKNNEVVIDTSALGIIRKDQNFFDSLEVTSFTNLKKVTDHYTMLQGKQKEIDYEANQQTMSITNALGQKMNITFNASNDGFAFKYEFPETSEDIKYITEEKTTYNFATNTKAWLQPLAKAKTGWEHTNPSYEEHYQKEISVDTPSPLGEGWVYPALFNKGNHWVAISETHLEANYAASHLQYNTAAKALQVTFPQPEEKMEGGALNPESTLPWETPWRIVALGDLSTVTNSTLGTDLAKPAITDDVAYIHPSLASWSWAILKDNSITYDITKKFIDYAHDMQWKYCLIEIFG